LLFVSRVKAILKCFCNDAPCYSVTSFWLEVVVFAICIIPDGSNDIFNLFVYLFREVFLVPLYALPDFLDFRDVQHFSDLAFYVFGSLMLTIRLVT